MNKLNIQSILNIIVFCLLLLQIMIFAYNSKSSKNTFLKVSNTVEKFTTMISGEKGVDRVTADKLIKINDSVTILSGEANLKSKEYEIKSSDVTVNSKDKKTSSNKKTITTNKQGTVISDGFEYDQNSDIIVFNGESEFYAD